MAGVVVVISYKLHKISQIYQYSKQKKILEINDIVNLEFERMLFFEFKMIALGEKKSFSWF